MRPPEPLPLRQRRPAGAGDHARPRDARFAGGARTGGRSPAHPRRRGPARARRARGAGGGGAAARALAASSPHCSPTCPAARPAAARGGARPHRGTRLAGRGVSAAARRHRDPGRWRRRPSPGSAGRRSAGGSSPACPRPVSASPGAATPGAGARGGPWWSRRGRLGGAAAEPSANIAHGRGRAAEPTVGGGACRPDQPAAAPGRAHLERARRARGLRLRDPRAGDAGAGRLPPRDDHERHDARRLHGRGLRARRRAGAQDLASRSSAGCWRSGRRPRRSRTSLLRHPARNTHDLGEDLARRPRSSSRWSTRPTRSSSAPPRWSVALLGGTTCCAIGYLLAERATRPVVARALAGAAPPRSPRPVGRPAADDGVDACDRACRCSASRRSSSPTWPASTWTPLATGECCSSRSPAWARGCSRPSWPRARWPTRCGPSRRRWPPSSRASSTPRVPVDDGSEVGQLQAGFNRMAAGLAERERLRDLFGRHVGRDVAHAALDGEIRLGGEVRDVAVLFVDLVGLHRARRPAAADRGRGPAELVLPAGRGGRRAARRLGQQVRGRRRALRLRRPDRARRTPPAPRSPPRASCATGWSSELPELDAGIGVSAGPAVAGNIGAEERFEYTVIGDPVNEAARLCELAKKRPERVLASDAALERAGERGARALVAGRGGGAARARRRPRGSRRWRAAR